MKDWVQYAIGGGSTTNYNVGVHENTKDGNWDSYCGYFSSGMGSRSITTTTTFEWTPTKIESVKFRCRAMAYVAEGGYVNYYYQVYLKLDGEWMLIDSGSNSGIKEMTGPWEDCGGIKLVTYSAADHHSGRECQIETYHYEAQAFGKYAGNYAFLV